MPDIFQLKDLPASELPLSSKAAEIGVSFLDLSKWTSRGVHENVNIYTSGNFAARQSVHKLDFEVAKKYLADTHFENESEYIPLISWYRKETAPPEAANKGWEAYTIRYNLGFPLREREMHVWLAVHKYEDNFVVVTLSRPDDAPNGVVKGRYVAIELVERLDSGIRWTMGTTSDAGGWLPLWVQRLAIPKAIANDVPHFLEWLKGKGEVV